MKQTGQDQMVDSNRKSYAKNTKTPKNLKNSHCSKDMIVRRRVVGLRYGCTRSGTKLSPGVVIRMTRGSHSLYQPSQFL